MRRRSESPSKAAEVREPVCSERDIRGPERSEGGFPVGAKSILARSLYGQRKGQYYRSDIRVSERSEDGFPVGARMTRPFRVPQS